MRLFQAVDKQKQLGRAKEWEHSCFRSSLAHWTVQPCAGHFARLQSRRLISIHVGKWQLAWTTVTWGLIEGRLSITFKSNGKRDLYHVTKFSLCLSPTIHQISTHELVVSRNLLSIRILWAVFIGSFFFFWEIVNLNLSRMFLFSGQQS